MKWAKEKPSSNGIKGNMKNAAEHWFGSQLTFCQLEVSDCDIWMRLNMVLHAMLF